MNRQLISMLASAAGTALALIWAANRKRATVRERLADPAEFWENPVPVPKRAHRRGERMQLPADGEGPLFNRRYRVDIVGAKRSPKAIMRRIKAEMSTFAPDSLARFEKVRGFRRWLKVGDRFDITIAGPWNGSVCVVDVTPASFSLVTLEGHPEAGQIRFQLKPHPSRRDLLRFEILSWARSRDMLVGVAYEAGGKQVQKNAWVAFCRNVVTASGGEAVGDIEVHTAERPFVQEVVKDG